MSDLKPGDRALVVGLVHWPELNGSTVTVMTAAEIFELAHGIRTGTPVRNIALHSVAYSGGKIEFHRPANLIRIPPDSEMRQMFRETSKPKETA